MGLDLLSNFRDELRRIVCAVECGTAVQGHPRSLILVAIENSTVVAVEASLFVNIRDQDRGVTDVELGVECIFAQHVGVLGYPSTIRTTTDQNSKVWWSEFPQHRGGADRPIGIRPEINLAHF